jgi:predicted Ser/Thr protein kinase
VPAGRDKTELPGSLGGYEIVRVLGEGGSGTVYLARTGGQEVALKVLRRDQSVSERERRRWLEEAEHLGRIRHRGVVRIFDAGELDDGRPYLAMELLSGQTLAERITAGPVPLDLALRLFDQLASAVQAIHDTGLIHRDLKPENLMLVEGGERVVVLDLGIARAADAPPSTTTKIGYQRGTPAVMAPERFFGERATVRTDIYELGVVLFVMLTGRLPWRAILDAQARLNPLRPAELGVTLPPAMEQALMRALASDAADRPATARELAGAIREGGWSGPTLPVGAAPELASAATGPTGHASDGLDAAPPAALGSTRTEETGGRLSRWAVRIAVAVGLALIATPVVVALLDGAGPERAAAAIADAGPERVAAATADAGLAQDPVVALPETVVQPSASRADAGLADDRLKDVRTRARPARTAPASPGRAAAPAVDAGATAAGAMPWCRKQAALYCTDEFKATEGNLAGQLCDNMTAQVTRWETYPPEARASLEHACEKNHAGLAAAAAERIRFYRERVAP